MKPIFLLSAAAALAAGAAAASAQGGMAVVPADRTTGPTVPAPGLADTRQIDVATAPSSTGPSTAVPAPNADNWRASSGLNGDPDNPNGAPGPSIGLGTSPGR